MNKIDCVIRRETANDHRAVETIIREAFWNFHAPGCSEHYFAHMMRDHRDFVPELDFVAEVNGRIAGSILYTTSLLVDDDGAEKKILTFGPIAVAKEFQRMGIGKKLMEHSFAEAVKLGFDVIVIFGNIGNYASSGFVSCKKHNVCLGEIFPAALLVRELVPGALDGRRWRYVESNAAQCCEDTEAVEAFDALFSPKEKKWQPSQEEFYISSHSVIVR